jgi:hypothetical protein
MSEPTLEDLQGARDTLRILWLDNQMSTSAYETALGAIETAIDRKITEREAETARRDLDDREQVTDLDRDNLSGRWVELTTGPNAHLADRDVTNAHRKKLGRPTH